MKRTKEMVMAELRLKIAQHSKLTQVVNYDWGQFYELSKEIVALFKELDELQ